jgi:regulatory protein
VKHARGREPQRRGELILREVEENEGDTERAGGQRDKVMASALRILSARACSEGELRNRLNARQRPDAELVENCIVRLKELGYVDDDRFARSYASYRVGLKPLGRARLERELAARKVPRTSIEAALDSVFGEAAEDTLIDKAITSRIRTHGRPGDRAAAKRMFDHLARRGFGYDLIRKKLQALKAEIGENDGRER